MRHLPESTSPASGGLRSPSPDVMSPDARRAEVAAILATGFLQYRRREVLWGQPTEAIIPSFTCQEVPQP
jgi:hypothetical protein